LRNSNSFTKPTQFLFVCLFEMRFLRFPSSSSAVLTPLVLLANNLLLLGGEVILDVEGLADFLGGLALDHVGHGFAGEVQKGLDVKVIGSLRKEKKRTSIESCPKNAEESETREKSYENQLKERSLVDLAELRIPLINIVCPLLLGVILRRLGRVIPFKKKKKKKKNGVHSSPFTRRKARGED